MERKEKKKYTPPKITNLMDDVVDGVSYPVCNTGAIATDCPGGISGAVGG